MRHRWTCLDTTGRSAYSQLSSGTFGITAGTTCAIALGSSSSERCAALYRGVDRKGRRGGRLEAAARAAALVPWVAVRAARVLVPLPGRSVGAGPRSGIAWLVHWHDVEHGWAADAGRAAPRSDVYHGHDLDWPDGRDCGRVPQWRHDRVRLPRHDAEDDRCDRPAALGACLDESSSAAVDRTGRSRGDRLRHNVGRAFADRRARCGSRAQLLATLGSPARR